MTIKKISLLVATLLLSANIYCQELYHNSIAPMLQLDSYSWGARYERIGEKMGGYVYVITGDFDYNPSGIHDEVSFGVGVLFKPPLWEDLYITTGLNYAEYSYYQSTVPFYDSEADMPISLDLGLSGQYKRLKLGINSDIIKWKWMIYIGYRFNFYEK